MAGMPSSADLPLVPSLVSAVKPLAMPPPPSAITPAALPPNYWGMMAANNIQEPRMTQGMTSNPEMVNRYLAQIQGAPPAPVKPIVTPAPVVNTGLSNSPGGSGYGNQAAKDANLRRIMAGRGAVAQ